MSLYVTLGFSVMSFTVESLSGGKIKNFIHKKRKEFYWGGFLNFFEASYITLSFSFCINLYYLEFGNYSEIANTVFALIVGTCLVLIPPILFCNLTKRWKPVKSIVEMKEGGELIQENQPAK